MTRETKIGMVVASSFLALVGVVVANKLKKPADAKDDTAAQQWITPKEPKVADATKTEGKDKKPTTLPANFLSEEKPPIDLPPANGSVSLPTPPAGLPDLQGLPGLPGLPMPEPKKDNASPFPPLSNDPAEAKFRETLLAQAEAARKKEGLPSLPPAPDALNQNPPKDAGQPNLPPFGTEQKDPPKDNTIPPLPPPPGTERKETAPSTGTPPLPPPPGVEPKGTNPSLPPIGTERKDPNLPPVGTSGNAFPPLSSDKKESPLPPVGSSIPPLPPLGSGNPNLPPIGAGNPSLPPVGSPNPNLPPIGSNTQPMPPIGSGNPLPPVTSKDNLPPLGTTPKDNFGPIGSGGLPPITTDRKDPPTGSGLPPIGSTGLPPVPKQSVDAPVIGKSPDLPPLGSNPLPPVGNPNPTGFPSNPPTGENLPRVNSFDFTTYKCQPEDTSFEALSNRHYRTTKYAKALEMYNANHPLAKENLRSSPPKLYSGGEVYIPSASMLEAKYAAAINERPLGPGPSGGQPVVGLPTVGTPTPLGTENTPPSTPPAGGAGEVRAYQVPAGKAQMIYEVAQQTLGNPVRWSEIYRLNPTIRPDQPIPPGTTLRVPAR